MIWGIEGTDLSHLSLPAKVQLSVNGTPFDPFKEDYVAIEFFATWCGPCVSSFPHLAKIQNKYPSIPLIQFSSEPPETVSRFLNTIKFKVPWVISCLEYEDWTTLSEAVSLMTIPRVVVLRKGIVVFSGNPNSSKYEHTMRQLQEESQEGSDSDVSAEEKELKYEKEEGGDDF
jgi:thiol-disulfide isomerase/thioredoxin